jgi:malate dehydrogenase (oxaloacetate-decarboxylating)(NADP+)
MKNIAKRYIYLLRMENRKMSGSSNYEEEEPLLYHSCPTPGKFTIKTTKPMNN